MLDIFLNWHLLYIWALTFSDIFVFNPEISNYVSFCFLLLCYPHFFKPSKSNVVSDFLPPKTSLVELYMLLKISRCTELEIFNRIWVWAFDLRSPRACLILKLIFYFNLWIFSRLFFLLNDYFFPISLFSFSHSHFY